MNDRNEPQDAEQTVIRKRDDLVAPDRANLADRVMGRVRPDSGDGQGTNGRPGQPGGNAAGPGRPGQNQPKPGAQRPSGSGEPAAGAAAGAGAAGGAAAARGQQQTRPGSRQNAGQGQGSPTSPDANAQGRERTGAAAQGVPAPARGHKNPANAPGSGAQESPTRPNPAVEGQQGQQGQQQGSQNKSGPQQASDQVGGPRAQQTEPKTERSQAKPAAGRGRRTRKARLRLSEVDPWSVMKTAFLFSIAGAVIVVIATSLVWSVLEVSGLFNHINTILAPFLEAPGETEQFDIKRYVDFKRVFGGAVLLAAINVAIITALATLGAFLYNLASSLIGGLEVTLAED